MKKIVAELIKWNGEKVEHEIERDWIDSIVSAITGQYFFVDNVSGFSINGCDFCHVNVYEVAV